MWRWNESNIESSSLWRWNKSNIECPSLWQWNKSNIECSSMCQGNESNIVGGCYSGRHVYSREQCIARISVGPTFDIGPTLAFDVHAVSTLTYKLATLRGDNGIGTPRGSKEVVDLYCIFIYARQRESRAKQ